MQAQRRRTAGEEAVLFLQGVTRMSDVELSRAKNALKSSAPRDAQRLGVQGTA